MATRHSREHLNPLKKKFISPNSNRKSPKFLNISPKFKSNLKEFHKHSQGKKEGNLKKKLYEMKREKREKYHLGGNSSDPLNLNSLINRDPMLSTPQASPHPTHGDSPIDVCLPHHDDDPLNLKCFPDEDLKEGLTPKKKKKKKNKSNQNDIENKVDKDENKMDAPKDKKKKKKQKKVKVNTNVQHQGDGQLVKEEDQVQGNIDEERKKVIKRDKSETSESSEGEPPAKKNRKSKDTLKSDDKTDTSNSANNEMPEQGEKLITKTEQETTIVASSYKKDTKEQSKLCKQKPQSKKSKVFIYGNYNRYYHYRNPQSSEDLRLKTFNKDWFSGKDVLDIGCNVGDITIFIAKQFEPRIIIGNDIDNSLIKIAKSKCQALLQSSDSIASNLGKMKFPMSFRVTNGPIAVPRLLEKEERPLFPNNVIFKQENYVPPDDNCLANQKPMYDTILCLSVTKWVHLNWGDQGLKRMFKKIFRNLRPGGRLILEPQPFASYKKRRKLTDKIRANYNSICFRPEQFIDYLLSDDVGFIAYEVLEEPQHGAPGFRRPIYLLTKPNAPKS